MDAALSAVVDALDCASSGFCSLEVDFTRADDVRLLLAAGAPGPLRTRSIETTTPVDAACELVGSVVAVVEFSCELRDSDELTGELDCSGKDEALAKLEALEEPALDPTELATADDDPMLDELALE